MLVDPKQKHGKHDPLSTTTNQGHYGLHVELFKLMSDLEGIAKLSSLEGHC
jgi:hypothetical protein